MKDDKKMMSIVLEDGSIDEVELSIWFIQRMRLMITVM